MNNSNPAEPIAGLLAFSGISQLLQFDSVFMSIFYIISTFWVALQIYYKFKFPRSK